MMNEAFLHYIWQFKLFNIKNLTLTNGERLEIIHSGSTHHNAGPDFFNAQLRIAETRWAGNVEIHLKSSDWLAHRHQEDLVYDKVILHVVWEHDCEIKRKDGTAIPTLELKGKVSRAMLEKYQALKSSKDWIPCEKNIASIDIAKKRILIDRMLVERLEIKSKRIKQLLEINKNDWETTLYQLLAKYFGFKINAVPFELLATSLPHKLLRKYNSLSEIEALLFGQAGFLAAELKSNYPIALKETYNFLAHKHQLKPIEVSLWKFLRMRPGNFPTIRIAQFAALLKNEVNLFQKIVEATELNEVKLLFSVKASTYWQSHYRFDIPSARNSVKSIGESSIDILIINVIVPLLFTYGEMHSDESMKEKAFRFLQKLPAEKNQLLSRWQSLNMPIENAYDSQALIQLKLAHCDSKKCLLCTIGNHLLKNKQHDT